MVPLHKRRPPKRKAPGGKPGAEAGDNSSRDALHTDYHKRLLPAITWTIGPDLMVLSFALLDRAVAQ